jgi:hypothetical protein
MAEIELAEFEDIPCWDVPFQAIEVLETRALMYTHDKRETTTKFEKLMKLVTEDDVSTYLAVHTKTYETVPDTEKLIYLADVDDTGWLLGYGEVRYGLSNQSEYFKDKLFTGYTQTKENYWHLGLGTRRMHIMNHATHLIFGLPLNSDTIISHKALPLWQRQVALGNAEKYMETPVIPRFRFLGLTAIEPMLSWIDRK